MNDNFVASQIWCAGSVICADKGWETVMFVIGLLFFTFYLFETYAMRKP